MELYLRSQHLQDVKDLLKDPEGNDRKEVNIEEFKLALAQVDSQMKSLPATAQVYVFYLIVGVNWLLLVMKGTLSFYTLLAFRLLLSREHIFLGALTGESNAKRILKVLDVLKVLGIMTFVPSGMQYTLGSSHLHPLLFKNGNENFNKFQNCLFIWHSKLLAKSHFDTQYYCPVDSAYAIFFLFPFLTSELLVTCESLGTSISGNSLRWGERKQQQSYLETGFPWAIALSGSGIPYMQGDLNLLASCKQEL